MLAFWQKLKGRQTREKLLVKKKGCALIGGQRKLWAGRLTRSQASLVRGCVFGVLCLVISRQHGQKLGKLSVFLSSPGHLGLIVIEDVV